MNLPETIAKNIKLYNGDCLDVLPTLAENSIDAVVTDPPYHLTSIVRRFGCDNAAPAQFGKDGAFKRASAGFMGQKWDGGDVAFRPETWREVYRVLKLGGYLVAFGGSRTYHRLACAIEDAGFIIHPLLGWIFGQGFPKAHSVSKAIDRMAGVERDVVGKSARHVSGKPEQRTEGLCGTSTFAETIGMGQFITAPATDAAKQWDGWFYGGQTLKPALEPICFAQKPFEKGLTGTQNVLKWGVGALNIDACRVGTTTEIHASKPRAERNGFVKGFVDGTSTKIIDHGRWPANVCHDGSEEALAGFPETAASSASANRNGQDIGDVFSLGRADDLMRGHNDSGGSAARFFYTAQPNEIEQVVITWISESEPHQATLLVDTGQLPGRAIVASASVGGNGWSTFLCGSTLTDLFQKASSCIIRTKISSTTASPIWSWLTTLLTREFTGDVNYETENGGNLAVSAEDGTRSLIITLKENGSLPGVSLVSSGTRLKISVSAARTEQVNSTKRFWYGSKADKHDRIGAFHPTIKPVDLIQWLCRMITPPYGTILDPFAGSGTTGEAAMREGFCSVLIEREEAYCADIRRRMKLAMSGPDERRRESIKARGLTAEAGPLFEGME